MTITSEVTDLATDTISEVNEVARDQYDSFVVLIRRNPLQSAGIAAGIGFFAALMARGFSK